MRRWMQKQQIILRIDNETLLIMRKTRQRQVRVTS